MASASDFRSQCPGCESCRRQNSAHMSHSTSLHRAFYDHPPIPSSPYDLNSIERYVKCRIIIIIIMNIYNMLASQCLEPVAVF